MQTISLKIGSKLISQMKKTIDTNGYSTKTEFIREAIRDKIREKEKEMVIRRLEELKGFAKDKHVTDEDLREAREKIGKEYAKRFGIKLD
jgi:metal-responsive CopG/Arc/MetJ family transcriptional regulator